MTACSFSALALVTLLATELGYVHSDCDLNSKEVSAALSLMLVPVRADIPQDDVQMLLIPVLLLFPMVEWLS